MNDREILHEIDRCIKTEADALLKLGELPNKEGLLRIVSAIQECRGKIVLSGCGTSAMAARKIVHSLNCVGRPSLFLVPSDAVHGGLGVLNREDLLILVSKGGSTQELVRLIPACKKKGTVLISVSENPESILAREADIYLQIKVEREPCRFNMLATASTLAVISTFDAICIAMMQLTGYTREQFAVIHPGGAVGDRLLGKAEDVK